MIEYGIALLCDKKISEKSLDIGVKIIKRVDSLSIDDKFLPHITLFQGLISEDNLSKLQTKIKQIFKNSVRIFMSKKLFLSFPSNNVFWNSAKSKNLLELHMQILKIGIKYSEGNLREGTMNAIKFEKNTIKKKYLEKYQSIYLGPRYLPHITIAKFSKKFNTPKINSKNIFDAKEIIIGEINQKGQMLKDKILFKVQL